MSNIGLGSVDIRWFEASSLERLDLSFNKLGRGNALNTKFLNIVRLRRLRTLVLAGNEIEHISVRLALLPLLSWFDLRHYHCCLSLKNLSFFFRFFTFFFFHYLFYFTYNKFKESFLFFDRNGVGCNESLFRMICGKRYQKVCSVSIYRIT